MKSMVASFPFSNGLGTIFLYSKRKLLTQHIRGNFASNTKPLPQFWVGPGDEATTVNLVMYRLPHEKKNYGFTPNLHFNPLPTRFNFKFLPPSGEENK